MLTFESPPDFESRHTGSGADSSSPTRYEVTVNRQASTMRIAPIPTTFAVTVEVTDVDEDGPR